MFTAVAFMVSVVPIDVSQYAEDIAKNTVFHLSSNSPSTRDHAQQLFKALAKLLSKVSNCTIGKLYQICLFILSLSLSLLGSPSGKLTVADHRCSVLLAIESLSLCPLSSSSQQQLASSVAEGLVTHIKQEGNIICTL